MCAIAWFLWFSLFFFLSFSFVCSGFLDFLYVIECSWFSQISWFFFLFLDLISLTFLNVLRFSQFSSVFLGVLGFLGILGFSLISWIFLDFLDFLDCLRFPLIFFGFSLVLAGEKQCQNDVRTMSNVVSRRRKVRLVRIALYLR